MVLGRPRVSPVGQVLGAKELCRRTAPEAFPIPLLIQMPRRARIEALTVRPVGRNGLPSSLLNAKRFLGRYMHTSVEARG